MSCDIETLQNEFAYATTQYVRSYDTHRWSKGVLAYLSKDFFKSMGLIANLDHSIPTLTGGQIQRIKPYLCVRKSEDDAGCFAVGNFFIGQQKGYEAKSPQNIPWKKKEQLEEHMKGVGAKIGILAGFTSNENTVLRFYKLNTQGNIDLFNPELKVSFYDALPISAARKICDLFDVK